MLVTELKKCDAEIQVISVWLPRLMIIGLVQVK